MADGDPEWKTKEPIDPAQESRRTWKDVAEYPSLTFPSIGTPSWANLAMAQPLALFGQALSAFGAGADAGTALLCRSALEAALYVFLTRRKMEGTEVAHFLEPPVGLDGRLRWVRFEELKRGVISRKVLSLPQEKAISRIQTQGNIIAHLLSRSDAEIFRWAEEGDSEEKDSEESTSSSIQDEPAKVIEPETQLWVTRQQAVDDVRDTAEIFKTLADSTTRPDEEGP